LGLSNHELVVHDVASKSSKPVGTTALVIVHILARPGNAGRPVEARLRPARAVVDRMLTMRAVIAGRACADVQVVGVDAGAVVLARTGSAFVHRQFAPRAYRHRVENRNRKSVDAGNKFKKKFTNYTLFLYLDLNLNI